MERERVQHEMHDERSNIASRIRKPCEREREMFIQNSTEAAAAVRTEQVCKVGRAIKRGRTGQCAGFFFF
jgi:hypothetical protein